MSTTDRFYIGNIARGRAKLKKRPGQESLWKKYEPWPLFGLIQYMLVVLSAVHRNHMICSKICQVHTHHWVWYLPPVERPHLSLWLLGPPGRQLCRTEHRYCMYVAATTCSPPWSNWWTQLTGYKRILECTWCSWWRWRWGYTTPGWGWGWRYTTPRWGWGYTTPW